MNVGPERCTLRYPCEFSKTSGCFRGSETKRIEIFNRTRTVLGRSKCTLSCRLHNRWKMPPRRNLGIFSFLCTRDLFNKLKSEMFGDVSHAIHSISIYRKPRNVIF